MPTNKTFFALSLAGSDALSNDLWDPKNLLDAHIVDGYYPSGSLSGSSYEYVNRAITKRLGQNHKFYKDTPNSLQIKPNYNVGNGNRV